MDTKILILSFVGLVALFTGAILVKKGLSKIEAWQKENPFKFSVIVAAIVAVVIAVFAGQNKGIVECWKFHNVQCLFPISR